MNDWLRRKPTGKNHARLLRSIASRGPSATRPLARAFLRAGNFACVTKTEEEECGAMVTVEVMGTLAAKARPGDACLDRALAVWALQDGHLTDEDAQSLVDELAEIAKLPEPERELPGKVMQLMRGMSDAVRSEWLALLPGDMAAENLEGLSGETLRDLFAETGLEAALLPLDPKEHEDFLLEAMQSNRPSLSDETLTKLLTPFVDRTDAKVEATLLWLAENGPCEASMTAAVALAERGNARFLPQPRRPSKDETEETLTSALCRIANDPDPERQLARYKEYLPPRGKVAIEHTGEWFGSEGEPQEEAFTRKTVTEWNLPSGTFGPPCTGDCSTAPIVRLRFSLGKDGFLYLSGVEVYHPYTTC